MCRDFLVDSLRLFLYHIFLSKIINPNLIGLSTHDMHDENKNFFYDKWVKLCTPLKATKPKTIEGNLKETFTEDQQRKRVKKIKNFSFNKGQKFGEEVYGLKNWKIDICEGFRTRTFHQTYTNEESDWRKQRLLALSRPKSPKRPGTWWTAKD